MDGAAPSIRMRLSYLSGEKRHAISAVAFESFGRSRLSACRQSSCWFVQFLIFVLTVVLLSPDAPALTPKSPEVRKLIDEGLNYLGRIREPDPRLGARCLAGLAFIKANRKKHALVSQAVEACREAMSRPNLPIDVYSNGIAIIFLCELNAKSYQTEIRYFYEMLQRRQKKHGGWGYDGDPDGDTSQTQYAALSLWELHRNGIRIDGPSVQRMSDWLLKTQDPSGAWGYHGVMGTLEAPAKQTETTVCMLAAGASIALIAADLSGAVDGSVDLGDESGLPEALRGAGQVERTEAMASVSIDEGALADSLDKAATWMAANFKTDHKQYTNYYLYTLERYKSFQEYYDGLGIAEPAWYDAGIAQLKKDRTEDGGWVQSCGEMSDTAFAILFMLRSTQKSLRTTLGDGTLVAGRGLPADIANARMERGQIIVNRATAQVDDMLSMLDDERAEALDQLAQDPTRLVPGKVDAETGRRLEQLARSREPEIRILAVRALSRSGNLDYVPTLIYALSDPDRRIVLQARDGLRLVSRRFEGFRLPDDFTEKQRYSSIERWSQWYRGIRPHAVLE